MRFNDTYLRRCAMQLPRGVGCTWNANGAVVQLAYGVLKIVFMVGGIIFNRIFVYK